MNQARVNIFDATMGVSGERTWLDSKVKRRELTQDLQRESLSARKERASAAAETFKDDLSRRAELRHGLEQRSKDSRKTQEEILKRKAEEYRERLRSKLRPEVWAQ